MVIRVQAKDTFKFIGFTETKNDVETVKADFS